MGLERAEGPGQAVISEADQGSFSFGACTN